MREQLETSRAGEQHRGQKLAMLSDCLRAGIYRGIPELALELSDTKWHDIEEANPYSFSHPDGSSFEVALFVSPGEIDAFADGTPIEGFSDGRKVWVRQEAEGMMTSESIIDLNTGHFAVNSPLGVLSYDGEAGSSVSPIDGLSEDKVIDNTRGFVRGFVASTPEYQCPEIKPEIAIPAGAIAVAAQLEATA